MAQRHLADPAGVLSRMPHPRAQTTEHRHLDPDRLDHVLHVTRFTEGRHRPMRELGARETRLRWT